MRYLPLIAPPLCLVTLWAGVMGDAASPGQATRAWSLPAVAVAAVLAVASMLTSRRCSSRSAATTHIVGMALFLLGVGSFLLPLPPTTINLAGLGAILAGLCVGLTGAVLGLARSGRRHAPRV